MSFAATLLLTVLGAHAEARPLDAAGGGAQPSSSIDFGELSARPGWRKLLHVVGPTLGVGAAHSDVVSTDFFLLAKGREDPEAELRATIAAMKAAPGEDHDSHAQCRFPARLIWLEANGAIDARDLPAVACEDFRTWRGQARPTGASLIFASGHLDNPASFYGHMLLRFDTGTDGLGSAPRASLLEKTLNYGAVYPENENGLVYIVKGLTGGYISTFTDLSFFNHQYRYTESQLRDAWVYKLDLSQDQTDLMVAHSWELLGSYNRYYFLRQNCAYRIAELISVVMDTTIVPQNKPWIAPVDVLQAAVEAHNGPRPLVVGIERLSSRRTEFLEKYSQLSTNERRALQGYVNGPGGGIDPNVEGLAVGGQSKVIEVLIDYYAAADSQAEDERGDVKQRKNELLLARMQRPAGAQVRADDDPAAPHEGQPSSLAQLSYLDHSELGQGLQLRLRGAYNDFLSLAPAALPYSELTFFDGRIDAIDGEVYVRSLEAIAITALNVSRSGLPEDGGHAWRVRVGAGQEELACKDCFVGYAEAGWGDAAQVAEGVVLYGLGSGKAVGPDAEDGAFHVGLTGGLIVKRGDGLLRGAIEASAWQDLEGDGRTSTSVKAELRFGKAKPWDLSLGVSYEKSIFGEATQLTGGVMVYW